RAETIAGAGEFRRDNAALLVRSEPLLQTLLHPGPLRGHDRVARRVARRRFNGQAMRAQDSFELRTDALEGRPRALVAHIGVETDAVHTPGIERVREHEELRLGVRHATDGGRRQPAVADLATVEAAAPRGRVTRGPAPALEQEEARRANDRIVLGTYGGKGKRRACLAPAERRVDVLRHLHYALRNGAPAVERGVLARRGN